MNNRAVLGIIFLTVFVDMLGFGMILPLLPIWAGKFTANEYLIISLGSVFSLFQFFFAPVWGRLSDTLGRRPVIVYSLLGGSIAYGVMALADNLTALYAARILQGVFTAGGLAAAPALIADITSPKDRPRGMGMIGAAFGLGFVFGPAFGAFLVKLGPQAPFIAAGLLAFANFLWAFRMLPETRRVADSDSVHFFDTQRLREAISNPALLFLFAMFFVNVFAFSNLEQTFSLFIKDNFHLTDQDATRRTGFLLTYVGVMAVIVQGGLIRPLAARFGEPRLLYGGLFLTGVGMLLTPLSQTLGALVFAVTFISIGWGLVNPCTTSLISKTAGEDRQGGVLGISQGIGSLARVFGPQLGGVTYTYLGIGWPYWIGGAILLASAAFAAAFLAPVLRARAKEQIITGEAESDAELNR